MKDLARRYSVPISQVRPKGARLLEGYSDIEATPEDISSQYLARILRIRAQTVRKAIPVQNSLRPFNSELRFCSGCMARGYHSVLHQFGRMLTCPIHARPLEQRCRHCG